MQPFTEIVIEIISSIPRGKVATYGQIAKMAGSPRSARQVGRILHTMTRKYNLPWHRVLGSGGKILIRNPEIADEQRHLLLEEAVRIDENLTVDLDTYLWDGGL